jgi:hypothetical protein
MPVLHDADISRGLGREATLATVTTATGAIALGVNGLAAYTPPLIFGAAEFDLNLTAAATDAADTLDVYVDTSMDGGTTWINIVHFTQLLGNGGAKRETMAINPRGNVGTAPTVTAADLAAAGVRHLLGSQYRVRYAQVDANANAVFTFTVKMRVLI